ncbi:ABC transporter substrate-binding protein [Chloroflexota bacterium]
MKRLALILLVPSLFLALLTSCASTTPPGPRAITDDLGRAVNIEAVPQRIISLAPNITEILFALDLGDKVVGVTDACDYPREALAKPKVGAYFATSLETIINQDPDIVLSDGHDSVYEQLESLGVTVVVIQSTNIDGILRDIELVGQITDKEEEAEELVVEMERRIDDIVAKTTGVEKPTVFYVVDASDPTKPWTAGEGSFIDALISLAGGENIAASEDQYTQFSLEALVSADPEIIIGPTSHGTSFLPDLGSLSGWKEMSTMKGGEVYLIEADLISRSGPRIVGGLEEMARIIHPELFP